MIALDRDILARIREKSVIVLSDRYPPYAHGGAEVSLHAALSSSDSDLKSALLVIIFDDTDVAEIQAVDGIEVLRLPNAARWPFHFLARTVHQHKKKQMLYERFGKYLLLAGKAMRPAHFRTRLAGYLLDMTAPPKGGVQSDFLQQKDDLRLRYLNAVLAATDCQVLVADNTRSILLAAGAATSSPTRKIAIVRDHRFSCARHNQSMMVSNKFCTTCDFACVPEDARNGWLQRRLHAAMIRRVAAYRRKCLASFDRVIVTSHFLARSIRQLLPAGSSILRIPNPAGRLPAIASEPSSAPGSSNAGDDARETGGFIDFMYVGMLNEQKGQMEFIKKTTHWLKANPRYRVLFAGRGERISKAIRAHSKQNDIEGQIVFLDYIDRPALFANMQASRLIILPTRWKEPFGRVPLEAALVGKPVVAFGVGGLCETIVHEHTGLLIKPGDYDAFTQACDRLVADRAFHDQLGDNARRHVMRHFSDDKTSTKLTDIIRAAHLRLDHGMADTASGRQPQSIS